MRSHSGHHMQQTSLQAYEDIKPKLGERHKIIFKALKELCKIQGDATDSEIMNHLFKQDPNYVRPRRHELVNKYKIVCYSQTRKCKIMKTRCIAWRIL